MTTYLSDRDWRPLADLLAERLADLDPGKSIAFLTRVEEPYYKTEFGMVQTKLNKFVLKAIQKNNNGEPLVGDVLAK